MCLVLRVQENSYTPLEDGTPGIRGYKETSKNVLTLAPLAEDKRTDCN